MTLPKGPSAGLLLLIFAVALALFFGAPLGELAWRSLSAADGGLTLAHYAEYLTSPGLQRSLVNTAVLGAWVVALVTPAAFLIAYGLERTRLPLKGMLASLAAAPLLVPSLLPALALVYLFGRQGLLKPMLGGWTIYGAPGLVIADSIAALPHAVVILRTALSGADARLYEQAKLLGASGWKRFWTITLPGCRHGLVAAALVVFALTIADVGAPKVVGGGFDVLALDIYKQVIGQQNFEMGAVVAIMLLLPTAAAILFERHAASRQAASVSAQAKAYHPEPDRGRDLVVGIGCVLIALAIAAVMATAQLAAVVRQWPYDLSLTGIHYDFDRYDGGGWSAITNSVMLALVTAVVGTVLAFVGAYLAERSQAGRGLKRVYSVLALGPAAVPGLALGLGFALFFNDPANPLHLIYGTVGILIAANVVHFFTVAHLTSVSMLKSLDPAFEPAARVLGRGGLTLFGRVIAPLSAPALVEIALYLFVNAMTTVSVVVFLYPPEFKLAAVAVLNMDDAGDSAPAAAMGMLILYVNIAARIVGGLALRRLARRSTPVETPDTVLAGVAP
ncbi:MAG: putative 2-aminoethylphosphonate ABC transporter permease subunit [Caulobacteraceae bacterium]|nr:putative 2-aminoethylphosphonate ABC transporter permease subunit [Caulobacteraceae bacterium]